MIITFSARALGISIDATARVGTCETPADAVSRSLARRLKLRPAGRVRWDRTTPGVSTTYQVALGRRVRGTRVYTGIQNVWFSVYATARPS